jgi:hypothetical protein
MSAATLLVLFALGAGLLAMLSWPARRGPGQAPSRIRGLRRLFVLMLCGVVLCALLLAVTVQGYRPWRPGTLIAELAVNSVGPRAFEVRLSLPGKIPQRLTLHGDQWQLDVRLLRWKLPAALLGSPRIYLPDRLSGRYADLEAERLAPRTVHALAAAQHWDAWRLQRRFAGWLPILASDYGSSAYLPLIDDTRFRVEVGDVGGIVAYPADAQTARRLREQDW